MRESHHLKRLLGLFTRGFYREGKVGLQTQCLDFQPRVCVCVCDGGYPGGPGPSYSKHAPGPGHISIIVNLLKCKISGTTANL